MIMLACIIWFFIGWLFMSWLIRGAKRDIAQTFEVAAGNACPTLSGMHTQAELVGIAWLDTLDRKDRARGQAVVRDFRKVWSQVTDPLLFEVAVLPLLVTRLQQEFDNRYFAT